MQNPGTVRGEWSDEHHTFVFHPCECPHHETSASNAASPLGLAALGDGEYFAETGDEGTPTKATPAGVEGGPDASTSPGPAPRSSTPAEGR